MSLLRLKHSALITVAFAALLSAACTLNADTGDDDGDGSTTTASGGSDSATGGNDGDGMGGDDSGSGGKDGSGGADGSGGKDGSGGIAGNTDKALGDYIRGIDQLAVDPAVEPTEVETTDGAENHDNTRYNCTYHQMQGVEQHQALVTFDPNADVLWPGSLVQGASTTSGILDPIQLPRAKGTITLSNINATGSDENYSRTVGEMTHANVQEAIGDILNSAEDLDFAAKMNFVMHRAYSLEEAAYSVGLDVDWMVDVEAQFNKTSWTESTNLFVRFDQAYFTASFDAPTSPQSVFAPSVTVDDLKDVMGAGNPPEYVASVVYGRTLLMRIESTKSQEEVEMALKASFDSKVISGELELSAEHKQTLDESKITIFALGGSGEDVAEIASGGAGALRDYLVDGANFSPSSPGVPISYTLRYLKNSQAVKVASATEFTIPECDKQVDQFKITVQSIRFPGNGDAAGEGENDFKYWVEVPGKRLIDVAGYKEAADGQSFPLNSSADIFVDATHNNYIKIGFWANDTGTGDKENVTDTDEIRFNIDTGVWTCSQNSGGGCSVGGQNMLKAKDGALDVELYYSVQKL